MAGTFLSLVETFELRGEYVTLGQLLKLAGIVGTGGEAKLFLTDRAVKVNSESEQRRGRKLRSGDLIEISKGTTIRIISGTDKDDGANSEDGESAS